MLKIASILWALLLIFYQLNESFAETVIDGKVIKLNHTSYSDQFGSNFIKLNRSSNIFSYVSTDLGRSDLIIEMLYDVNRVRSKRIPAYIPGYIWRRYNSYDMIYYNNYIYIVYCSYSDASHQGEPSLYFEKLTTNLDRMQKPVKIGTYCDQVKMLHTGAGIYIHTFNSVYLIDEAGHTKNSFTVPFIKEISAIDGGFAALLLESTGTNVNPEGGYNLSLVKYSTEFVQLNKVRLNRFYSSVSNIGDSHSYGSIAVLNDGNFAIAWTDASRMAPDSSYWAIHSIIIDKNLSKVSKESVSNKQTDNRQSDPYVSALANGGFLIAWESYEYPARVKFREFDKNGGPVGNDVLVQTQIFNRTPSKLARMNNGLTIIYWESDYYDGDGIFGALLKTK